MKITTIVRFMLMLGLVQAAANLCSAETYKCMTWVANQRTIVGIDDEDRPRCSGGGQVRVATVTAEPYENVEMHQDLGDVVTTFMVAYSDWDTYITQNYGNRYQNTYVFLNYLPSSLFCSWTCPTPYQALDAVVPAFEWGTHGGLPYTASGAFSGNFYFY